MTTTGNSYYRPDLDRYVYIYSQKQRCPGIHQPPIPGSETDYVLWKTGACPACQREVRINVTGLMRSHQRTVRVGEFYLFPESDAEEPHNVRFCDLPISCLLPMNFRRYFNHEIRIPLLW